MNHKIVSIYDVLIIGILNIIYDTDVLFYFWHYYFQLVIDRNLAMIVLLIMIF